MSKLDDKATAVEPDSGAASPHDGNGPGGKDDGPGFIILFFFIGLAVSLIIGWGISPKFLYSKKSQPFNFDHKLHVAEVDNGCESCHYFRSDGSFSGIPELAECMQCHEEQQGETEDETIFMNQYVYQNLEVPWFVYSRQPDCVFFSHAAHVKMGKMSCETCHGHIGESEYSRVYEENRISGYSRDIWGKNIAGLKKNTWDRMKMDDCADCHEKMTGRRTSVQTQYDACFVCHK